MGEFNYNIAMENREKIIIDIDLGHDDANDILVAARIDSMAFKNDFLAHIRELEQPGK